MKKCSTPQWTKRRPTPTPERVGDYSAGSFISGNFVTFIIRPFHSNTYEVLRYTLKSTWYQWLPVVPRLVIHSFINKEGVVQDRKKQVTPKQPSSSFFGALFSRYKKHLTKRNARVARHKSAPFRSAPLSPTPFRWRTRWFSRRRRRRRRHGERRCRGDADDARVVVLREVVELFLFEFGRWWRHPNAETLERGIATRVGSWERRRCARRSRRLASLGTTANVRRNRVETGQHRSDGMDGRVVDT